MRQELRLFPEVALVGPEFTQRRGVGLSIIDGKVAAIADTAALRSRPGDAQVIELPDQVVMAGFVNAHQHGRGITQFQLGFPDDVLEVWMPGLRRAGILDPYWQTLLASLDMIASGVVGAIHANTAYGSGDPAAETREMMRAYADSGLRAAVGLGLWDRAGFVYPSAREPAFLGALPGDLLQRLQANRRKAFCATPEEMRDVLGRLRAENETARVKAALAPAGPQWVSDPLMRAALREAADAGCIVHMHVMESWVQYLTVCELHPEGLLPHLAALGPVDELLSFGHAVWLGERDADMAAARGVTLVRNAGSNLRLKAGIAPLAEYRRRGVRMAIGTDSFSLAEDEDILKEARLAGRLAQSPRWDGPPAPGPVEMLQMLTQAGAAAGSFGPGVLAEGNPADLVAIDLAGPRGVRLALGTRIADLIYYRAGQPDVRMTMVAGEVLYRDGKHTRHDRTAVAAKAAEDVARAATAVSAEARADIEALTVHLSRHYSAYARERNAIAAAWPPLAISGSW
jgi:cytosine/adenosine deaminase-related metal-dependent hydrolase